MRTGGKALAALALGTIGTWMTMAIGVSVWGHVLGVRGGAKRVPAVEFVPASTCRLPRPASAPLR